MQLEPVAVEITYGLERIAMYLQEVTEVWQLKWNDTVTYGMQCNLGAIFFLHSIAENQTSLEFCRGPGAKQFNNVNLMIAGTKPFSIQPSQ